MSDNIYQRINAVRQKIDYIQKDASVQGYKAVTHDAVTAAIRPHLIEEGILICPRLISSVMKDTGTTTGSGTPFMRYEAWYEIDFINVDEPDQKITIPIEAHALDHGDKAPGKTISYATKFAMLKLFNIETGENEESRYDQKPKPYTDDEMKIFCRLIESEDQLGFYLLSRRFLDFTNQNMEGWTSLNSDYLSNAKRGNKGKEKERLTEFERTGKELYMNIYDAIESEDAFKLSENMEGAGEYTKKMLWHSLTEQERETAKKLMENQNEV